MRRHGVVCGVRKSCASTKRKSSDLNYDETKVPKYTLPDPLVQSDGSRVKDAETWRRVRRPEILRLYETEVFRSELRRDEGAEVHASRSAGPVRRLASEGCGDMASCAASGNPAPLRNGSLPI